MGNKKPFLLGRAKTWSLILKFLCGVSLFSLVCVGVVFFSRVVVFMVFSLVLI